MQHIALLTDNIINSITYLKARGVDFLGVPATYYEALRARLATVRPAVTHTPLSSVVFDEAVVTSHLSLPLSSVFLRSSFAHACHCCLIRIRP